MLHCSSLPVLIVMYCLVKTTQYTIDSTANILLPSYSLVVAVLVAIDLTLK